MDLRHIATSITKRREIAMAKFLSGEPADLSCFPCSAQKFELFLSEFRKKYPGAGKTERIGGLGEHYDLMTALAGGESAQGEAKTKGTGKPSSFEKLRFQPWRDTVQFLQGQIKSKIGQEFLGDCGDLMVREWFEKEIKPFSEAISPGMTYEGYAKAMSTIGMTGIQEEASVAFIQALRSSPALKRALKAKWLAFEERWFSTHTMDHEKLKSVVVEVIHAKHYWVCVSKDGPQLIDGLKVVDLRYAGVRQKPRGGMSFHYTLTLESGEEKKDVPMECKFHWKNGGQAVQNLNFMLL
jgi:hypothetical protein